MFLDERDYSFFFCKKEKNLSGASTQRTPTIQELTNPRFSWGLDGCMISVVDIPGESSFIVQTYQELEKG